MRSRVHLVLVSSLVLLSVVASTFAATFKVKEGASGSFPYDSWANAAATIQEAVYVATNAGDVVLVTNGTYSGRGTPVWANSAGYTNICYVTNGITVESVNGPSGTFVDPAGSTKLRGFWLSASATDAVISGFTVRNVNIPIHTAVAYGAGINMFAGTVTNCVVTNCESRARGGGIWLTDGCVVTDSEIVGNRAIEWQMSYGAGVFIDGGLVERCWIHNNQLPSHSGGAGVYQVDGTLRNCVITDNDATYFVVSKDPGVHLGEGGGVRMTGGRIENCTVADNTAKDKGAGIYATGGTVTNCVVYHNASPERFARADGDVYNSGGTISYVCTPYLSGTGNTTNAPQFTDRANGDYTLLPGSPCIDTGAAMSFGEDKDGNARPADGDGYGIAAWDIGAYEAPTLSSRAFSCNFDAPRTEHMMALSATFSAHAVGSDTNLVYFWWDFNKGGSPAMQVEGADLWTVATNFGVGYYDVELTVSNVSGAVSSLTKSDYIKVHPATLYVSAGGTHDAPFDTWAKAANDIESAVQVAYSEGGTTEVVIADGTYAMSAQIELEKGIRVRGTNGPSNCTLTVPAQNRSFYIYHPDAVVEGLTLTTSGTANHLWHGAGAFMLEGMITNCIIRDIVIGGRGAAIWMAGGTVSDCTIVSNRTYEHAYGYGGGIYIDDYSWYSSPLVENCEITHNESQSRQGGGGVYMKAGTLRNCLVVTNRCTINNATEKGIAGGVLMTGGGLVNCTVVGNFSVSSGGGLYLNGGGFVTNTISYYNTVDIAPAGERNIFNSGGTVDHSCIDPAPVGTANTALAPNFEDYLAMDFNLVAPSPCIDEGVYQAWMTGAVDIDGNDRIRNGDVDMGALEAPDPSSGPLISGFNGLPVSGFTNIQAVLTAEPVGLDTNIQYYWWTLGNGNTEEGAAKAVVTNTYESGYYDVTLVMMNLSGEMATNSKPGYIKVAPPIAYVSTSSVPVAPYMTWADAAASVQDALTVVGWSASGDHTVIAVTNGEYAVGRMIQLNTNYTIMGVGTAVSNVVLQGGGSTRLFNLSVPGATLSGVSVKGGYQSSHLDNGGGIRMTDGLVTNCIIAENGCGGQGGGVWMSGGVVSDCTFVTNRSVEWQYGRGGGAYIEGGTIKNSVFRRNITTSWVGGGGVYVAGGLVRNCLMTDGWADSYASVNGDGGGAKVIGGVLESCTIVGNRAEDSGGGLSRTGGTVTNCIVVNNTADDLGDGDGEQDLQGGAAGVYYSCSPDLTDSVNDCITAAPTFMNASAGNYRLTTHSAGINAGYDAAWMLLPGARDLAGGMRLLNSHADMGAYETLVPPAGTLILVE